MSRLNEAERGLLRLLAEGHTAKSISNLTGSTPVAVNERLREARRKTGVGSSRELARLLRSQEDRHVGIVSRSRPIQTGRTFSAVPWRPETGVFAMVAILLIALAGVAALRRELQAPTNDPVYATFMAEEGPIKALTAAKTQQAAEQVIAGEGLHAVLRGVYAKVRSEPRDSKWATEREQALRAAFSSIPNIGVPGSDLRVICAKTLCEVGGTVDTSLANTDSGRRRFNSDTMSKLNPKALSDQTDRLNLESVTADIGAIPNKTSRLAFLFYYQRQQ